MILQYGKCNMMNIMNFVVYVEEVLPVIINHLHN